MARLSSRSGASKPFTAWTTVLYLLLVFIAPLAFFGTAHAEEETPQENYGTGMLFFFFLPSTGLTSMVANCYVFCLNSRWYRFGNYLQLCWCDAERKG